MKMEPVTYYSVLGIIRDAPEEEIKAAYRQKAKELHPDRNSGVYGENTNGATKMFQQVTEAYETLSDPQKRAEYDRKIMLKPHKLSVTTLQSKSLQNLFKGDTRFLDSKLATESYPKPRHERPINHSEEPLAKRQCNDTQSLPKNILPPLSNLTQRVNSKSMPHLKFSKSADFNGNTASINPPTPDKSPSDSPRQMVRKDVNLGGLNLKSLASIGSLAGFFGSDTSLTLETTLSVSFDESVTGCQKKISFHRSEACSCQKELPNCDICAGSGMVNVNASLDVNIPAGVVDGCKKRLREEGHASAAGRKGDLILTVNVGSHPFLRRRGQTDVECDLPVSFAHAALGVVLQIPSIRGNIKVTVPPGTQPNEIITIVGAGFVDYRNPSHLGNMLIRVIVQVPKKLSQRQRELLKEFEKASFAAAR